ncbi:DUF4124 domain-containing protein [Neisseria sp. Ec49-e6-T10]|uniref:DUF4124 domain-containing protein n=1 Tax=Neisseria sp. Ec49-e6-T10 TaxID=3140744 RepID=UPI003EBEF9DF
MKKVVFTLLVSIGLISHIYAAPVYRCIVGKEVTFTNKPGNGCKAVNLGPISVIGTEKSPSRTTKNANNTANNNYPKESAAENATRNQGRRQILEAELANEQKALADAQKALTEGQAVRNGNEKNYAKYQERVQQLQNAVSDRQKNIDAIQKEISRL